MRRLEKKGLWLPSRVKPCTPSKLLLTQESQAAEGNAQQQPPSQGWGWTQLNRQGPPAPPATPLMPAGLPCP